MKRFLIVLSVCLNILALLVLVTVLCSTDFHLDLDTGSIQTTHEITEAFQNIHIDVDTTDLAFFPSADGTCKVICTEKSRLSHTVSVQNDTLTIGTSDLRGWTDHLFSFGTMSANIYLPQSQYASLVSESDTGDLDMPGDFLFASAELETDTGDIRWQADVSGRLSLFTDTGDILLSGCHAGALEAETDTGDVRFDRADGDSIFVETDTGDVTGTLLTEKLFRGLSDTGRVNVPWDTRGGDCIVISDTGDIELSVAK